MRRLGLKDLRKKIAQSKGVPPYAVFAENSLSEMATIYPCTLDELKNVQGVGEGKAKKYGTPIVEAIAVYVQENDIDRPQDMVFKSVANKSALKVYIIQSTDRKLPLEDIASAVSRYRIRKGWGQGSAGHIAQNLAF